MALSLAGLTAGALALSGASGLLGIPDAGVLAPGVLEYQRSALQLPAGVSTISAIQADQWQFSPLSRLELGVKLSSSAMPGQRESHIASYHAKLQLYRHALAPDRVFRLALGARQTAAEASIFPSVRYLVGDLAAPGWRLVAGYGHGRPGSLRERSLAGGFAGLSYAPRPWLDLLLDHDGAGFNAGLRLKAHAGRTSLYAQGYVRRQGTRTSLGAALGLRLMLGRDERLVPRLAGPSASPRANAWPLRRHEFLAERRGAEAVAASYGAAVQLAGQGVCAAPMQIRAQGVSLMNMACDAQGPHLRWRSVWADRADGGGASWLAPLDLRLEPILNSRGATEQDRLDGMAAARFSVAWQGPLGLGAYGVWQQGLIDADDQPHADGAYEHALQYTGHIWPGGFVQFSAGRSHALGEPADFVQADALVHLLQGRVALDYSQTRWHGNEVAPRQSQRIWRAFVWAVAPRFALAYSRGQFLVGGDAQQLDLYRYFGRSRIGLYYKIAQDFEVIGVQFSIALTPSYAFGNHVLRMSGTSHFSPSLETQIKPGHPADSIVHGAVQRFVPQRSLIDDVLDQWRYNPHYIGHR